MILLAAGAQRHAGIQGGADDRGLTAARLIRDELRLTLPVLAMTAGVMESERDICMAAGMDDFIAKPIDVEQLLTVIARHLPADRGAAGAP